MEGKREHPVVDNLLGAVGLVAGGGQTEGAVMEQAGLQPGGQEYQGKQEPCP